jgi:hypothetical protein
MIPGQCEQTKQLNNAGLGGGGLLSHRHKHRLTVHPLQIHTQQFEWTGGLCLCLIKHEMVWRCSSADYMKTKDHAEGNRPGRGWLGISKPR